MRVGHDVHFVCDAGFRLVGSERRVCRPDRTWSGTQPFCRSEVERGRDAEGSALPGGSSITLSWGVPSLCCPGCSESSPEAAAAGAKAGQQDGARMGFSSWCVHKFLLSRYRQLLQPPVCQQWDLRGRQPELHVSLPAGLVRAQLPEPRLCL